MKEQELVPMPKQEQALEPTRQPTVPEMMWALINQPGAGDKVAAIKELAELQWKMDQKQYEKDFALAFSELQKEVREMRIEATTPVPAKDGTIKYRFAPMEDIMEKITPLLTKHGFTLDFSNRIDGNRLVKIGTLSRGGHTRVFEFPIRIGAGPYGSSESQADGAAATQAKRYLVCDMFGVVIRTMDNAEAEGDYITPEQVEWIKKGLQVTSSDIPRFLKFAGAKTIEEIRSGRFDELKDFINKKEAKLHATH